MPPRTLRSVAGEPRKRLAFQGAKQRACFHRGLKPRITTYLRYSPQSSKHRLATSGSPRCQGTVKVAFVVQLKIHPESQRQGHARAALGFVEQRARHFGLSGMALQVFAHNPGAQALYESVGYKVSSINMIKPFAENDA